MQQDPDISLWAFFRTYANVSQCQSDFLAWLKRGLYSAWPKVRARCDVTRKQSHLDRAQRITYFDRPNGVRTP